MMENEFHCESGTESEQIAAELGLTDVGVDIHTETFDGGYQQIHLFFDGALLAVEHLEQIEDSEFRPTMIDFETKCIVLESPEDQVQEKKLVTDGGSETYVAHAAARSGADARQHEIEKDYGRAVIDDCGGWNWSLSVEEDGTVRASKAIPYDGTQTHSTKEASHSRTSRRHGSQFGLSVEQVVDRYVRHSQTDRSGEDLLEDVENAREARGVLE